MPPPAKAPITVQEDLLKREALSIRENLSPLVLASQWEGLRAWLSHRKTRAVEELCHLSPRPQLGQEDLALRMGNLQGEINFLELLLSDELFTVVGTELAEREIRGRKPYRG